MKRTKISLLESLDKELDAEGKIKNFENDITTQQKL